MKLFFALISLFFATVTAAEQSQLRTRRLTECDTIEKCYLLDREENRVVELEEATTYTYEAGDRYKIQCFADVDYFHYYQGICDTSVPRDSESNYPGCEKKDGCGAWRDPFISWECFDIFRDCDGEKHITAGAFLYSDRRLCDKKVYSFSCPTEAPTVAPTEAPTMAPTSTPTVAPTPVPTDEKEEPMGDDDKKCKKFDIFCWIKKCFGFIAGLWPF